MEQSFMWMLSDIDFHGAHPMFNLFEGNIGTHFQPDSTWGSSSHSTIFRNYSTGTNLYVPPANARGALQLASAVQETANSQAFSMDWLSHFNNLVGVIAGSNFLLDTLGAPSIRKPPTSGRANPTCIDVGYLSASSSGPTPNNADATMFYHGVYNCADGSFLWDANHPNHSLPASFYLSAKPSWWGSAAWPPIGPDVSSGNFTDWVSSVVSVLNGHVNAIPAIGCFNTSTINGTRNVTTFDANSCYKVTSTSVAPPTSLSAVVQ